MMFAQDLNLEPWAQVMMGGFSEGSNLPASNVYITNCICIPKPYWNVLDDIQWVERRLETARWDAVGRREKAKNLLPKLGLAWVRDWMIKEKIRSLVSEDPSIKANIRKNTYRSFWQEHSWWPTDLGIDVASLSSPHSPSAFIDIVGTTTLVEHTSSRILRIESLLPPDTRSLPVLWNFLKYTFISEHGRVGRIAAGAFDSCLTKLADAALRFDCYQKESTQEEALRFIASCISSYKEAIFVLETYAEKKAKSKRPSSIDFIDDCEEELDDWPRALSLRGFCKLGEEIRLASSTAKNIHGLSLQDFLSKKGSFKENKAIGEADQKVYNFQAVEEALPSGTERLIGYGKHRFGYTKDWELLSVDGHKPTDGEVRAATLAPIDEASIDRDITIQFLIAENSHYS